MQENADGGRRAEEKRERVLSASYPDVLDPLSALQPRRLAL